VLRLRLGLILYARDTEALRILRLGRIGLVSDITIGLRTDMHARDGGSAGIAARACKAGKRGLASYCLSLSQLLEPPVFSSFSFLVL